MKRLLLLANCCFLPFAADAAATAFETDVVATSVGDLTLTLIGHGTLMLSCSGMVIHIDPVANAADYKAMPKANLIIVTHEHGDHLDKAAIASVSSTGTMLVVSKPCVGKCEGANVMQNGDKMTVRGVTIEAVPAYNIVNMRGPGKPYHPKGEGNGYILSFGDTRVYIAGDSENTPEMKALKNIAVAFLPMNLPYTMTPAMVADAAKAFSPKILYPYHFGDTDTSKLTDLLKDRKDIEVRIRKLK